MRLGIEQHADRQTESGRSPRKDFSTEQSGIISTDCKKVLPKPLGWHLIVQRLINRKP